MLQVDLVLHVGPQVEELRAKGRASCIAMGKKPFHCVDSGLAGLPVNRMQEETALQRVRP